MFRHSPSSTFNTLWPHSVMILLACFDVYRLWYSVHALHCSFLLAENDIFEDVIKEPFGASLTSKLLRIIIITVDIEFLVSMIAITTLFSYCRFGSIWFLMMMTNERI